MRKIQEETANDDRSLQTRHRKNELFKPSVEAWSLIAVVCKMHNVVRKLVMGS